jgi:negative regulator of flagellin synthesis FlgM
MKINPIQSYEVNSIHHKKNRALPAGEVEGAGDTVRISAEAMDALTKETGETREARIERIRSEVAAGTYHVDSGKVADAILKSLVLDEKA